MGKIKLLDLNVIRERGHKWHPKTEQIKWFGQVEG